VRNWTYKPHLHLTKYNVQSTQKGILRLSTKFRYKTTKHVWNVSIGHWNACHRPNFWYADSGRFYIKHPFVIKKNTILAYMSKYILACSTLIANSSVSWRSLLFQLPQLYQTAYLCRLEPKAPRQMPFQPTRTITDWTGLELDWHGIKAMSCNSVWDANVHNCARNVLRLCAFVWQLFLFCDQYCSQLRKRVHCLHSSC